MGNDRPTELAEHLFTNAFNASHDISDFEHVGRVFEQMLLGLRAMSVGLRATYMKLEEMEAQLQKVARQSERAEALARYQPVPPFKNK